MKFYITTPIYYANAAPHLGHLYSTLIADVAARWHKLRGDKVFFLTGMDEHGQKIAEKALELGLAPQKYVDTIAPEFQAVMEQFCLEYDYFIRTTNPSHHIGVIDLVTRLIENGDVYKSSYTGYYCTPCETFVTDENSSKVVGQSDPKCPSCHRDIALVKEENYFFSLSSYASKLLDFYQANPNFIHPKERLNEIVSFVSSGLKDLSISRKTVSWGIPFPGDRDHTVYVWCDALTNYLTGVGYPADRLAMEQWWPVDLQIIGKDILRFHAVYWPAFLMAAGLELPKQLLVHGHILVQNEKMSKSLGNAVKPAFLADMYGVDQIRYYLMRYMTFGQDGNIDFDHIETSIDADLANNLGNLVNRVVALALNNGVDVVTCPEVLELAGETIRGRFSECLKVYVDEMNHLNYHLALGEIFRFLSEVNAYVHSQKPWILAKTNKDLFSEVLGVVAHAVYGVAVLLLPVMPNKMQDLFVILGSSAEFVEGDRLDILRKNKWRQSFVFKKGTEPLFLKISGAYLEKFAGQEVTGKSIKKIKGEQNLDKTETITIDHFAKMELLVGTIIRVDLVAGSEKLLKLFVDCGDKGERIILSGVAQKIAIDQLIGKQGVFVANLPIRKMMGIESYGMMLYASDENQASLVTVAREVKNGTRVG